MDTINQSLTTTTFIESELKKFETDYQITEAGLLELAESFKGLKVVDVNDKEGIKAVREGRKTLKAKRVVIEKGSKAMRDSATKFNKAVLARERELVSIIGPTEDELQLIEDNYDKEVERLREEAERKESEKLQARLDKLNAVNYSIDIHDLQKMPDDYFEITLKEATAAFQESERLAAIEREKEQERLRIEEATRKEEEARLAKEREAQEASRKKLEEEQAAFRAEQEKQKKELEKAQERIRIQQEEHEAKIKADQETKEKELQAREAELKRQEEERIHEAQLEAARKEAAEKARIELEEKAKREAQEKIDREQKEKEEQEQKLLFGEDSDRFAFLSKQIFNIINHSEWVYSSSEKPERSVVWTSMKSDKGKTIAFNVRELLQQAFNLCESNTQQSPPSGD